MEILKSFIEGKKLYDEKNRQLKQALENIKIEMKVREVEDKYINTKDKFIKYVLDNMSLYPIKSFNDIFPDDDAKKEFGDYLSDKDSIVCKYKDNDCYIKINGEHIDIFVEYKREIQDLNLYYNEVYLVEVYRIDL